MPKTNESKTKAVKTKGIKIKEINYFAVEMPDMDPKEAGKLRLEIADEIAVLLTDVQKRYPDNEIKLSYGFFTGTGMFDLPLIG